MDWSAQTNEIMKTWGEAQKQLWSGWMTLAQGANLAQSGQMFDPMQFFRMGADTWSGLREGPAQRLAGNIVGGPEIMTRSMNMLMQGMAGGDAKGGARETVAAGFAEAAAAVARGPRQCAEARRVDARRFRAVGEVAVRELDAGHRRR